MKVTLDLGKHRLGPDGNATVFADVENLNTGQRHRGAGVGIADGDHQGNGVYKTQVNTNVPNTLVQCKKGEEVKVTVTRVRVKGIVDGEGGLHADAAEGKLPASITFYCK